MSSDPAQGNFPSLPQLAHSVEPTPERIDWFGEVSYGFSAAGKRRSEPSVKVMMSRVLCDPGDEAAMNSPGATDHAHQREAWLPVSRLGSVRIGDVWSGGRCISEPTDTIEFLGEVEITPETTTIIKAGLPEGDDYLLPLAQHPWHRLQTQAYCVRVMLDDGRSIIVPCMDLIRFYFGASSSLLHRLFTEEFHPDRYWQEKRYDKGTGHLYLKLAEGMSGWSAAHVARIAECTQAQYAAARIHHSCMAAMAEGHPPYPICTFPFWGKSRLGARGIWLPLGDAPDRTFVVFHLASCSHHFPFSTLSFDSGVARATKGRMDGHQGSKSSRKSKPNTQQQVDGDPGRTKTARTKFGDLRCQFPDLQHKSVRPEKITVAEATGAMYRRPDGSIEVVSYGEQWGSPEVRQVDCVSGGGKIPLSDAGPLPEFVQKGLASWVQKDWKVELVVLPGLSQPVFELPMLVDENGEIDPVTFCVELGVGQRHRQACVVEATWLGFLVGRVVIVEAVTGDEQPEIFGGKNLDLPSVITSICTSSAPPA